MRRALLLAALLGAVSAAPASAATYRETVAATPGVVAHWPLDEATAPIVDVVNGLSGTPATGYALLRPAGIDAGGTSLWLASGSSMRVGTEARHNFAGDRTVEAWVAPAATNNQQHVLSRGTATSGYHLYLDPGGIPTFRVNGTSVRGPALTAGRWHHVVGTLTGRALRLYVNGREAGTSVELPEAPVTSTRTRPRPTTGSTAASTSSRSTAVRSMRRRWPGTSRRARTRPRRGRSSRRPLAR
jgi:hypothetical protein